MSTPSLLNVVVAHAAEARPLIERYRLQKQHGDTAFPVFAREGIQLVVSGTGKVAAASATAYLHAATGGARDRGWLNVGICGHADLPLGSVRLGHKVTDRATGRSWYPQRVFAAHCPGAAVLTLDAVDAAYPDGAVVEMEAAGFCEASTRFSTLELVHVLKVVSDNRDHPFQHVTPQLGAQLVQDSMPVIERLLEELSTLARQQQALHAPPPDWSAILERWHFTATQRVQLRAVLRRWQLRRPSDSALEAVTGQRNSRLVLKQLALELERSGPLSLERA